MRLLVLICLTMIAFAGNSVLTRMAVQSGTIDPSGFALIRVISGAVVLGMIMTARGGHLPLWHRSRLSGAGSLALYLVGFSLAYLTLDAGLGALILFGVVQMTMMGIGAATGQRPSLRKLVGAGVAFAGLIWVLWPSGTAAIDPGGAALMVVAGIGWGIYSLVGRGEPDALAATAANFLLAVPVLLLILPVGSMNAGPFGLALAIISGGLTSGVGYTMWYRVLPQLEASTAAIVQLSVPVIAILAGAALLSEPLTLRLIGATVMVLGGIAWAVTEQRSVPKDHS